VGWEIERVDQCPEMQAGASHDQRRCSLIGQRSQHRPSLSLELGHTEPDLRIDQIDHVMRNSSLIRGGRFSRPDVHPAIHLHGVDRDHMGAEILCESKGQATLSGRRRTEQR
jgi:hypothetical protein